MCIRDRSSDDDEGVEYAPVPIEEDSGAKIEARKSRITDIRVTQRDIDKYGTTPGCEACGYSMRNEKIAKGVAHSSECGKRIRDALMENEEEQERIRRADQRQMQVSAINLRGRDDGTRGCAACHICGSQAAKGNKLPRHIGQIEREMRRQMLHMVTDGIDVSEIYL